MDNEKQWLLPKEKGSWGKRGKKKQCGVVRMMEEGRKCCSKEHREAENNEELQQFGSDVGGRMEEMVNVLVHDWLLCHKHNC